MAFKEDFFKALNSGLAGDIDAELARREKAASALKTVEQQKELYKYKSDLETEKMLKLLDAMQGSGSGQYDVYMTGGRPSMKPKKQAVDYDAALAALNAERTAKATENFGFGPDVLFSPLKSLNKWAELQKINSLIDAVRAQKYLKGYTANGGDGNSGELDLTALASMLESED